jgi:hypothetical protein
MKCARQRTVSNEVRQRTSKDLKYILHLAFGYLFTFLLFFCCFGCQKEKSVGNQGFSRQPGRQRDCNKEGNGLSFSEW